MLTLRIPWYVTVLDLGLLGPSTPRAGNRQVVASGAEAKATKRTNQRPANLPTARR